MTGSLGNSIRPPRGEVKKNKKINGHTRSPLSLWNALFSVQGTSVSVQSESEIICRDIVCRGDDDVELHVHGCRIPVYATVSEDLKHKQSNRCRLMTY